MFRQKVRTADSAHGLTPRPNLSPQFALVALEKLEGCDANLDASLVRAIGFVRGVLDAAAGLAAARVAARGDDAACVRVMGDLMGDVHAMASGPPRELRAKAYYHSTCSVLSVPALNTPPPLPPLLTQAPGESLAFSSGTPGTASELLHVLERQEGSFSLVTCNTGSHLDGTKPGSASGVDFHEMSLATCGLALSLP